MKNQISSGLKTLFLIHFVVALVFGLVYVLIPEWLGSLVNLPTTEPSTTLMRVLGAAVLAFGFGSWYAYRATTWDQVKIVVQIELVWTILGGLVSLLAALLGGPATLGWISAVMLAAFAVAFWIFYSKQEAALATVEQAPLPKPALKAPARASARVSTKSAARRRRR